VLSKGWAFCGSGPLVILAAGLDGAYDEDLQEPHLPHHPIQKRLHQPLTPFRTSIPPLLLLWESRKCALFPLSGTFRRPPSLRVAWRPLWRKERDSLAVWRWWPIAGVLDERFFKQAYSYPPRASKSFNYLIPAMPLYCGTVDMDVRNSTNSNMRTARASSRSRNLATYKKRLISTRRNYSNGIRV
jgi:hypothetical protein